VSDQCRAVTDDGERCSRPAEEDGFCHQHGPENETVDEAEADGEVESTADEEDEPKDTEMDETDDTQTDGDDEQQERDADEQAADADARAGESDGDPDGEADIVAVRNTVQRDVPALIDRELDGVTSVVQDEDGWIATVEMVERHSVPDTQDILGHYEVSLDEAADIDGYRRIETYRRAEGRPYEG
jgi:hypothetical protein